MDYNCGTYEDCENFFDNEAMIYCGTYSDDDEDDERVERKMEKIGREREDMARKRGERAEMKIYVDEIGDMTLLYIRNLFE